MPPNEDHHLLRETDGVAYMHPSVVVCRPSSAVRRVGQPCPASRVGTPDLRNGIGKRLTSSAPGERFGEGLLLTSILSVARHWTIGAGIKR